MTKLLVLSDSHRCPENILRILHAEKDATAVIFLGDGLADMEQAAAIAGCKNVYPVRGNCDYNGIAAPDAMLAYENLTIFYTHGHLYEVKYDLDTIARDASIYGADIALFGHTHIPCCERRGGVLLFNPGTCGRSFTGEGASTYGVLTLENGRVLEAVHKRVRDLPHCEWETMV